MSLFATLTFDGWLLSKGPQEREIIEDVFLRLGVDINAPVEPVTFEDLASWEDDVFGTDQSRFNAMTRSTSKVARDILADIEAEESAS